MLNLNKCIKTKPKPKPTLIFKNCSYVCVSLCTYFRMPSVLWRRWLSGRKGIRPVKKNKKNMGDGGGGHWLVRMEWRPAGWSVSASVNLPLHHKVQKFSSGTGSPGWSRKKGHKTVVVCWWWCVVYNTAQDSSDNFPSYHPGQSTIA